MAEEWLRPLAYQGGNERDENATDEPECPFPLDDNDDQAIQGAVATLQTLAVSFVLMFSFVCRALPSARRRCMCLSRGTGRRVQSISRSIGRSRGARPSSWCGSRGGASASSAGWCCNSMRSRAAVAARVWLRARFFNKQGQFQYHLRILPMRAHAGPCGPMRAHAGPCGAHAGPCGPIRPIHGPRSGASQ